MEITSRELDANLILIIFSLKKNFNVFLGDSSTYRHLLKKKMLIPGIVLTKSVTHGEKKSNLHNKFKSQGFILTSIDHEHGVLDNLDYKNFFIKSRIEKKELEKFDAFFCWGDYDYKNLIKSEIEECFYHKNLKVRDEEFRDLNSTSENICVVIYQKLRKHLSNNLDLKITLSETLKTL